MKEKETYLSRIVDETEVEKYLSQREKFNDSNQLIEVRRFDHIGNVILQENRMYDGKHLTQLTTNDFEVDLQTKSTFKYEGDLLAAETEHLSEGTFVTTEYKYDKQERILSIRKIDEEGSVLSQELTSYEGRTSLKQYIDDEEFIFRQEEEEMDENDWIISRVSQEFFLNNKSEEEEQETIEKFEYDANYLVLKHEMHRYDKLIFTAEAICSKKDLLTKNTEWDIETDVTTVYEYFHDHKDNLIKEIWTEGEQQVYCCEIFYDQNGEISRVDTTKLEMDNYWVKYRENFVVK